MKSEVLLKKLFPEGQRKLVVSLIGLAVAIVLEKFTKTGLSDNMQESIIAIVAIFTGGNVMEHLGNALKIIKGTKVGQIIEDIMPGDQGLGMPAPAPVEQKEEEGHQEVLNYVEQRMGQIEDIQRRQTKNIEVLVANMNRILSGGATQQPTQRPPYKEDI